MNSCFITSRPDHGNLEHTHKIMRAVKAQAKSGCTHKFCKQIDKGKDQNLGHLAPLNH